MQQKKNDLGQVSRKKNLLFRKVCSNEGTGHF